MSARGPIQPPPSFTFEGKTYTFGYITHSVMAAMQEKLYAKHAKALAVLRDQMDPAAYQQKLDSLIEREDKGEFAFESPGMEAYLQTMTGAAQIIALLLGASEDEVLRMLQIDPATVNSCFQRVKVQSLSHRKGNSPKANARTPQ